MQEDLKQIKQHLEMAATLSQQWQVKVQNVEGDSDLYRKLSFYLTPTLYHWINGMQAGNMKDLENVLAQRAKEESAKSQSITHQGDGHEVLTEIKK
jgi:hypothetical protein